jgi:aminoglycoside 6-adenylyltransferase
MNSQILTKIIDWAKQEDSIKVLILNGSLAGKGPKDELSDYDVAVFTNDRKKLETDDSWIHKLDKVWVYEPCEFFKNGTEYQTRLVIYKDGLQVDFALYDLEAFECFFHQDTLPVDFNLGYKVLLDKDGLTKNIKPPTYEYPYSPKPTQKEFDLATRIFFFESFKEAKSLARDDLGHAKIRDFITKKYLLKMTEWNEKAKHGFNYDTNCAAKKMKSWIDKTTWLALHNTFAHFDAQDSWHALVATMELFSKLAKETANILEYEYLDDVDKNIRRFVDKLKK